MSNHYPFSLVPLPYPPDALEPYIDRETVLLHHDKHLKKYIDTLNKTLENYPEYHSWSLEKLLIENKMLPTKIQTEIRNNAGGVFNHELYFYLMGGKGQTPSGVLEQAIIRKYGSFENFKEILKEEALSQFGSGYAWLVANRSGNLSIVKTLNQDTALAQGLYPLLLIDVWEHAYYLKYKNRRDEYIDNWFNTINWRKVEESYLSAMKSFV